MNDLNILAPLYAACWLTVTSWSAKRLLWTPDRRRAELDGTIDQLIGTLRLLVMPMCAFRALVLALVTCCVAIDLGGFLLASLYVSTETQRLCLGVCSVLWLASQHRFMRTTMVLCTINDHDDPREDLHRAMEPTILGDLGCAATLGTAVLTLIASIG